MCLQNTSELDSDTRKKKLLSYQKAKSKVVENLYINKIKFPEM